MVVITWEQVDVKCGDDDNVTITIQELSDGSLTGKQYSARFHKVRPVEEFKAKLKEQILIDRLRKTEADTFLGKLDLPGFEGYLNQ